MRFSLRFEGTFRLRNPKVRSRWWWLPACALVGGWAGCGGCGGGIAGVFGGDGAGAAGAAAAAAAATAAASGSLVVVGGGCLHACDLDK